MPICQEIQTFQGSPVCPAVSVPFVLRSNSSEMFSFIWTHKQHDEQIRNTYIVQYFSTPHPNYILVSIYDTVLFYTLCKISRLDVMSMSFPVDCVIHWEYDKMRDSRYTTCAFYGDWLEIRNLP